MVRSAYYMTVRAKKLLLVIVVFVVVLVTSSINLHHHHQWLGGELLHYQWVTKPLHATHIVLSCSETRTSYQHYNDMIVR
jgi:hypothetical protein